MLEPAAYLVVNGDDAGLHPATDEALLEAARAGILRSASVLVNGPTAREFVARATAQGLGLGLHLNLSQGSPLSAAPASLVGPRGTFLAPKARVWQAAAQGTIHPEEVAREVRAQWDLLLSWGVRPDHLDSHNHVHAFPCVLEGVRLALGDVDGLYIRVPDEPECPPALRPALPDGGLRRDDLIARTRGTHWRVPQRFAGFRFSHEPREEGVTHLAPARPGVTEWMVHPGQRPGSPFTRSARRARELAFLCAPETRRRLVALGYRLLGFAEVPR